MKIIIRIIGTLLALVKLSTASDLVSEDLYASNNILGKVKTIPIGNLLDFKKISVAIKDEFDKARFHYIIAYEIDRRKKELDNKFINKEQKYRQTILSYENELSLTPYQYTNEKPRFDHVNQSADISKESISKDIHRIQAELARTQFTHSYNYYKRRLNNYKNYLITLHELYKCKVNKNQHVQLENYSNFSDMYQGIKLFHDSLDDASKIKVQRDILGKVLYIDWKLVGENDMNRRREFEYHNDGLLSKIIDKYNDELVSETIFGGNDFGDTFFEYIFFPGFISHNYNYYTEIFYRNMQPSTYKFTSLDGHVVGTIYKELDESDHLVRETWYKGKTNNILREFTSKFDQKTGGYKLIERDHNGKIVNQEIALSNIN